MTLLIFSLYAQDKNTIKGNLFNSYRDELSWDFFDDSIEITKYTEELGLQVKTVNYTYINKGPYSILKTEDNGLSTEYVALLHENKYFVLLYQKDSQKPLEDGFFGKNSLLFSTTTKYTTKNYLTEGKVKYLPKNLKDLSIGKPWVEDSEGAGIGDTITIQNSQTIEALVISNGFVSYKTSTFYNNNRVKKLRITNKNNDSESFETILPDNAIPTDIIIPFKTKELILEIIEVYKGDKYDDTCINFILCKTSPY